MRSLIAVEVKRQRIYSILESFGPNGASAREVQDRMEDPDRDSPHYTKSVIRRALEVFVAKETAVRVSHWPSRDVTYIASTQLKLPQ